MIYDLRLTICSSRREEALISLRESRSSVRSEIFVARASSKSLKPRRGGITRGIQLGSDMQMLGDVAPTELCSIGGDGNYKYAAPDGAICDVQHRRTV